MGSKICSQVGPMSNNGWISFKMPYFIRCLINPPPVTPSALPKLSWNGPTTGSYISVDSFWRSSSSMVMRDFTLRSSPQFGSLVIIRMFLDELVTHIITNKLQKPNFQIKNQVDIKSGTFILFARNYFVLRLKLLPRTRDCDLVDLHYTDVINCSNNDVSRLHRQPGDDSIRRPINLRRQLRSSISEPWHLWRHQPES